ncbi:WD40-repeat-containing domain protein [Multifurca ochricompacta]|uniref:WD40-repeat-containing domain protein n=1 Tax=Multifurca ochricompacta TaxID=376703 RepID=A0AAD4ME65_9AGAM|nr:WD40-repeat-containing domain protein [Multifurca ochricompacta]
MGKQARKRQRKHKLTDDSVAPLGTTTLLDDKDDEERRLESLLFGKPFVAGRESKTTGIENDEEEVDDGVNMNTAELEGMLDSDLFFVDDGSSKVDGHITRNEVDVSTPEDLPDFFRTSGDREPNEASDNGDEPEPEDDRTSLSATQPPKGRKAPAWVDPDDASLEVSLSSSTRLRKLRDAPDEDVINGREYERRLRRQFMKVNPTPEWATNARRKRRRTESGTLVDVTSPDLDLDMLVTSSGGILGRKRRTLLDPGVLSIERLRDANQAAQAEGEINALQFHPSPQVSMLLIASSDRRIRLFNVDGHTNPHLQTLHIPALPVTNAQFHPSGSSILFTGHRPFYYSYDLQSGATTRSPRGLWGTTFANRDNADLSMEVCAFNPGGELLAVAGRRGYVYLVDWRTGAGQVVGSVKANTSVRALWWLPNGRELMTLGEDAEAYLWDISTRRCVHRWKDDGGFGSRVLAGDRSGNYIAIGSKSGIVNVYGSESSSSSWSNNNRPKPLKAISNLTTSISVARFNHDSQLLAIASKTQKDQMRLIHIPSLTAFSNWPTSSTPLGHVTSVDFSPGNEYVAIGNTRGRVLLYHLKDYDAYGSLR